MQSHYMRHGYTHMGATGLRVFLFSTPIVCKFIRCFERWEEVWIQGGYSPVQSMPGLLYVPIETPHPQDSPHTSTQPLVTASRHPSEGSRRCLLPLCPLRQSTGPDGDSSWVNTASVKNDRAKSPSRSSEQTHTQIHTLIALGR